MGLNLLDLTSNNNDVITNNGAVEANDAPSGLAGATKCVELDTGDSLIIADAASLRMTGNLTIEAWIYNTGSVGLNSIFSKYGSAGNRGYSVYIQSDESPILNLSNDGTANYAKYTNSSQFSLSTWEHWAFVHIAGTPDILIYKNGSSVTPLNLIGSMNAAIFASTADGLIENGGGGTMRLSDLRVWNTARSAGEISGNYQARLVGNESGLVMYLPFEHLPPIYTRGSENVLPTTDADLENYYTETEYTDVATSNDVRVDQDAVAEFMIHQFKDDVGGENSANLTCELQTSVAPSASTVYLQIYNRDTTTWDTVDSDNSSAADTDFTLSASVADLTNYKDANDIISCRVYQEAI